MEELALKHSRPRALSAASRAHDAAKTLHAPTRTTLPRRYSPPLATDVLRCPFCDCAACGVKRDGKQLRECVWCGAQSQRTPTGWLLVGELGAHHA